MYLERPERFRPIPWLEMLFCEIEPWARKHESWNAIVSPSSSSFREIEIGGALTTVETFVDRFYA